MNNPWEEIKLDDYEKHMSLDSVKQLQTINKMMKEQFDAYQVNTAMIFGIAGGNGLEHVSKEKYQKILEETESFPNGKALLRIDFKKGKERTYGIN